MNDFNFDMSALQEELTRVTVDKKPGAPKKFGNFLDKVVKMPEKDGYVTIRLLPALPGQKLPYAPCRLHNLAPIEERSQKPPKTVNIYCGRMLKDRKWVGDCFCCDYYNYLYRLSDSCKNKGDYDTAEQYIAKAKAIKPQEKYYYNAIVLESNPPTGQTPEDGPLIYSCGITIHTRILEAVLGNKEMNKKPKGNVFHPINGRNLKIVRAMKPGGQFPDYTGSEWEDPCPLHEDSSMIEKWLGSMNDIYSIRNVITEEEMKRAIRVFEGIEQDTRKSFDASFLNESSEASSVSVSNPVDTNYEKTEVKKNEYKSQNISMDVIDDDPLVDEELASIVRNAINKGNM